MMDPKVAQESSEILSQEGSGKKRPASSPEQESHSAPKKAKCDSNEISESAPPIKSPHHSPNDPPEDNKKVKEISDIKKEDSKSIKSEPPSGEEVKTVETDGVFVENATLQKDPPSSNQKKTEKKKGRLRKKAFLNAVLDQMEFYFSDCNLRKDRFLRKLYDNSEDGFVDLTVFGNFNKLQSLHKDGVSLRFLSKALEKSALLELNKDGTKVKRKTPLVELDKKEIDKRTVYVEYLPRHANHAWVQKIFSQCGKVCYVSLPTFKTTKQMKGFAFVEFQSPEEADKACQMLNNPLTSKLEDKPGKFPKGNKTLNRLQKIVPVKLDEDENEENTNTEARDEQDNLSAANKKKKKKKSKKRRSSESASEDCAEKNESKQVKVQEGKKKKKKKKKKNAAGADTSLVSEEESSSKGKKVVEKEKCDDSLKDGKQVENNEGKQVKDNDLKKASGDEDVADAGKDDINRKIDGVNKEIEESVHKKKRKRKRRAKSDQEAAEEDVVKEKPVKIVGKKKTESSYTPEEKQRKKEKDTSTPDPPLSERKKRKLQRQEDIRRKREGKLEKKGTDEEAPENANETEPASTTAESVSLKRKQESDISEGSEMEDPPKVRRKSDGSELMSCLVKSKKQVVQKKVEFNPVPITTEFIKRKEVRRRKKVKRDSLHLRVITKTEWLTLKSEYIGKQKAHMSALKKSLKELRQQEEQNRLPGESKGKKHVDLTDVFGTKRLKPTLDIKLAHLEELKFVPNVIVQWKCSHEMPREKIRSMFKEISGEHIDYIEAQEEAKSGYIRFKDEKSAEIFAKLSRQSPSFSARVLPESQQASYWEKANKDRIAKLSRKRNERGSERIARKVFERNKATFHQKPSHIVFDEDDKEEKGKNKKVTESQTTAGDEKGDKDKDVGSNVKD